MDAQGGHQHSSAGIYEILGITVLVRFGGNASQVGYHWMFP